MGGKQSKKAAATTPSAPAVAYPTAGYPGALAAPSAPVVAPFLPPTGAQFYPTNFGGVYESYTTTSYPTASYLGAGGSVVAPVTAAAQPTAAQYANQFTQAGIYPGMNSLAGVNSLNYAAPYTGGLNSLTPYSGGLGSIPASPYAGFGTSSLGYGAGSVIAPATTTTLGGVGAAPYQIY